MTVDDKQLSGVTGIFHHAILAKRNLDEVGYPKRPLLHSPC